MSETPFQTIARAPNCWMLAADNMQYAAKLLWDAYSAAWQRMFQIKTDGPDPHNMGFDPHTTLGSAAFMLAGLCLENLVKYIRIKQDPSLVQPDKIDKTVTIHELRRLFVEAGIQLSANEEKLVGLAEKCVVWAGKYPFPKKIGDDPTSVGWHGTEFEVFERLSSRLRGMI
jgi:hypothetical protein